MYTHKEKLIKFEGSNGMLIVNNDGTIHKSSQIDGWLKDIVKVDIEELINYHKLQQVEFSNDGDVLDFGWWDISGNYYKPDKGWRSNIFHNVNLSCDEINDAIKLSYVWIDDNRGLNINKVTVDNLDAALRLCDITMNRDIIDKIIDLVELLGQKGDNVTMGDITKLKAEWVK